MAALGYGSEPVATGCPRSPKAGMETRWPSYLRAAMNKVKYRHQLVLEASYERGRGHLLFHVLLRLVEHWRRLVRKGRNSPCKRRRQVHVLGNYPPVHQVHHPLRQIVISDWWRWGKRVAALFLCEDSLWLNGYVLVQTCILFPEYMWQFISPVFFFPHCRN